MKVAVRIAEPQDLSPEEKIERASTAYLFAKAEADRTAAHAKVLRDALFAQLESAVEPDSDGHLRFTLSSSVNGVSGVVKQRRVSRSLNEQRALEIIEEKGLKDLVKTVEVVDEDAVMAALIEGLLTEDEIDSMFPAKVTFAMITEKEK